MPAALWRGDSAAQKNGAQAARTYYKSIIHTVLLVPSYLEHPQYPHHPDQPQYLPCPPYHHCVLRYQEHHYYQTINNLHLELLHSKGQEIRKNSQQVHNVQRSLHELRLAWGAGQMG